MSTTSSIPQAPDGARVLFEGKSVILGEFRRLADAPNFGEESIAHVWPSFSFPRVALGVHHADAHPMLGDLNTAILFTVNRPYRRIPVDSQGSWTEWIEVRPDLVDEMVREFEPLDSYRQSMPFRLGGAPAPTPAYLCHRLTRVLSSRLGHMDGLELEERSLEIAASVIQSGYAALGKRRISALGGPTRTQRQRVFEVQERLNMQLGSRLTLSELSSDLEVSPFHLCRTFQAHTGVPIHQYRNRLRLRASLSWILETRARIVDVALDLGYSSESHFCDSFRRHFGFSPGELRSRAARFGDA